MKQAIIVVTCLVSMLFGSGGAVQAGIFDVLNKIESQSPDVWDFSSSKNDFVPARGGIKVCKAENRLIIGFYLSQKNLDFYNQKFLDGKRKPLGFEIDIVDDTNGKSVFDNDDYDIVDNELPSGVLYRENHMGDNQETHTLAIDNPTQLNVRQWYTVTFQFPDHQEITSGTFQIQVQLVGNMEKLRDDYSNLYDQYTNSVRTSLTPWLMTHSSKGNVMIKI
jgi:hypothetical protein